MSKLDKRAWPLYLVVMVLVIGIPIFYVNFFDQPSAMEMATYRLKWLANAGFAGDLYADTYGYYTKKGLKVEVRPGGPEHDAIRELQTNRADFGVASADQVIRALAEGSDVEVVAQIYQKNPVCWIYRNKNSKIEFSQDLIGKSIGVTKGDNDDTIMTAILNKASIPEEKVKLVSVRYDLSPFLKKQIDLFPVYMNTQGVELRAQLEKDKEDVGFFDPDRNGVVFIANSIVTTSRMMKEKPNVVRAFVSATLEGWRDALASENQDLAVRAILRFLKEAVPGNEEATKKIVADQIKVTRDLVIPVKGIPLGKIDEKGWKDTEQIMYNQKLIEKRVNIERHLITTGIISE